MDKRQEFICYLEKVNIQDVADYYSGKSFVKLMEFELKRQDEIKLKNSKIYQKVIEDIQEAQISCGGRFLRQSEIESMTVKELLQLLIPNEVNFDIKFVR